MPFLDYDSRDRKAPRMRSQRNPYLALKIVLWVIAGLLPLWIILLFRLIWWLYALGGTG
jgi:hypothetical protein